MNKKLVVENEIMIKNLFPKQASKGDLMRLKILNAAIQMYAKNGIKNLPIEEVARLAKISRPLLQHYFPDKKELFRLSMQLVRTRFQSDAIAHIQKATDPRDRLVKYIESTFVWVADNNLHGRAWLLFFYACSNDPELKHEHSEMTTMGETRIKAMLKDLSKFLKVNLDSDSELTFKAKTIQRLITGALIEIGTENLIDPELVKKQTVEASFQLIAAVL